MVFKFGMLFPSVSGLLAFSFFFETIFFIFSNLQAPIWPYSSQPLLFDRIFLKRQLVLRSSSFVIPTNDNNPALARPSDLTSGSGATVCTSVDSQSPAASSFQSVTRRRHWQNLPRDDSQRPRKLFFANSIHLFKVAADSLVARGTSPGLINDVILPKRALLRCSSLVRVDARPNIGRALVVPFMSSFGYFYVLDP